MKNLIIILLLSIVSISLSSQVYSNRIASFLTKEAGTSNYTNPKPCNIPIILDLEKKQIFIYKDSIIMIDFMQLEKTESFMGKEYNSFFGGATDSNYEIFILFIHFHKTKPIMFIEMRYAQKRSYMFGMKLEK